MARDDIDTRQEAISQVLDGLQWLIIHHANSTAREQYLPRESPDASDDYIKENKEWVQNLRKIRLEFEDLVTGLIE
jgi:hypothetical protein